jgi:hypothetical protein
MNKNIPSFQSLYNELTANLSDIMENILQEIDDGDESIWIHYIKNVSIFKKTKLQSKIFYLRESTKL